MKPIALQLYTLRDAASKDFLAVLRRVAEIGYKGVEPAGLYGHSATEIAAILEDFDLTVCSSHTALPTQENVQDIADIELTLSNKKVISGLGPDSFKTLDDCMRAAGKFNEAVELLRPYGMEFGIHNHWWEFKTVYGVKVYDILMKECPGVFGELDVYWTAFAGTDPVEAITEYKARLPLFHIKDGTLEQGKPHLPVGSGKLDIPAIIGAADQNVLQWLIVELDEYDGDMFGAVEQSYNYLISNGLAKGRRNA